MNETPSSISIHTQELREAANSLEIGQRILLSGEVYTARDAAHKRLVALLEAGAPLPFSIKNACIYYAGPTPAPPGKVVGSVGPTTSARMDPYTPQLLAAGLLAMIGKGARSPETTVAIQSAGALYFCALGGAGALAAACVRSVEELAFPDLGCESIKRLELTEFPLILSAK